MYPQRYPHLSAQLLAHQGHTPSLRRLKPICSTSWAKSVAVFTE